MQVNLFHKLHTPTPTNTLFAIVTTTTCLVKRPGYAILRCTTKDLPMCMYEDEPTKNRPIGKRNMHRAANPEARQISLGFLFFLFPRVLQEIKLG